MAAYLKVQNKLVTCPYDEAHKVKESRLQLHITKCRLNHLDKIKEVCPFNATHVFDRSERDFHVLNCPDKAPLDRKLAQSVDRNNPFKGHVAVPSYSVSAPVVSDENWDLEISSVPAAGYTPQEPPPGAIIEPKPLSKPSERRHFYQNLHRMNLDQDKPTQSPQPPAPSVIPRQPNEASRPKVEESNFQGLGLGRGKSTRIAANIFPFDPSATHTQQNDVFEIKEPKAPSYSEAMSSFAQLSISRGKKMEQTQSDENFAFDDEEDFPVLGRGARRITNTAIRPPGAQRPGLRSPK